MKTLVLLLLIYVLGSCTTAPPAPASNATEQPAPSVQLKSLLFAKSAARIQAIYLEKVMGDTELQFYKGLSYLAAGNRAQARRVFGEIPATHPKTACAKLVISDQSHWRSVAKILEDFGIPQSLTVGEITVFNPFDVTREEGDPSNPRSSRFRVLWSAFYAAAIMGESARCQALLVELQPFLENSEDRAHFQSIANLSAGKTPFDLEAFAWFFLLTGSQKAGQRLNQVDIDRIQTAEQYYRTHFLPRNYIVVNAWTQAHKHELWLAARNQIMAGNQELGRVFLQATLDRAVLTDFNPDSQVRLYASMTQALNLANLETLRFVEGALKSFTSGEAYFCESIVQNQLWYLMN